MSPSANPVPTAFDLWLAHNGRDCVSTEVAVQQVLHEAHPSYHVTRTTQAKCDVVGFANAGHATKTPHRDDGCDMTLFYKAPKLSQEEVQGKLVEDIKFGGWAYAWEGNDFLVYEMWFVDLLSRQHKYLYVLAPDTAQVRDGRHPDTNRLLRTVGEWTRALHDEIYVFDDATWKKDKGLYRSVRGASWDDVVMDSKMKSSLVRDVENFFYNRALYQAMNVPWKRGVIFHGVPGNGKTISIKAIINSLAARDPAVPALYVKSLDGCRGPKWAIQTIFAKARVMAPCLLIFEDLDSMVEDKTRSYFLNEVDGLDSNEGILMIGSTNHLSELDPAITKRPSRFDRKYHFHVPEESNRLAYCRYWKQKFAASLAVDFQDELCPLIAKMTDGFSFAYLKELFVTALLGLAGGVADEDDAAQDMPASESDSASDGVVVKSHAAPPEAQDADKSKDSKLKRVMPQVLIPEHLQQNILLKAVLTAARTLWEQMDNSEEEASKKKKAASCPPNPFDFGMPMGLADED